MTYSFPHPLPQSPSNNTCASPSARALAAHEPCLSSEAPVVGGVAGMYDWYQDGEGQDPKSIVAGKSVEKHIPNAKIWTHENRAMVNRAVRLLAREGLTQIIDLGSGKPSPHGKSTHEAVSKITTNARVLYVEIEETAVAEGKKMIDEGGWGDRVAMIQESALNPAAIMQNKEAARIIDWEKPVVLVMSALVHFFRPEQYRPMMVYWRKNLWKNSALILTHGSFDEYDRGALTKVLAHYERMGMKAYLRSREELIDVLRGWELMEPGLVRAGDWRPATREEGEGTPSNFEFWWVGVARL